MIIVLQVVTLSVLIKFLVAPRDKQLEQSITQEEAAALQAIEEAGYKVKFQLLPDVSIGYWSDFKSKFGY